ncbi:BatD family protein [Vibrio cincinnatiensis]|uniref:BatD family protein n=1 Tax=Vibrio cincinnatiensis TaxID=675 RepID=UPI001EDE085C|nr:BatD family protein [Vibrio cincinnatiensis]
MITLLQFRRFPWLMLLLSTLSLSAHASTLSATVSKNKVVKNEVFQLRIISDRPSKPDAIDFHTLENDFFTSRPSFASSVNIVNGERSQRSEWTLSLAANRLGIITIPSFELDGQKTQPIAIQVTADEQAPNTEQLIEMHSTLSRNTLYPQESTQLHIRLLIKTDVRRLQNPQLTPPSVEGMTLTPVSEAKQYQTVIDGVEVTVLEQDFRLTAEKAGQFHLTEAKFQGSLIYNHRYDNGTRIIPFTTTPKTYSITVEDKPTDYQGAWLPTSQLTLTEQWQDSQGSPITHSPYSIKVGEAISREITLQVAGLSPEQLPKLTLSYPEAIRVYEEKPQITTQDNGETVMTVKHVLIPRRSGEVSLPKMSLNWWNTKTKQQQVSQTSDLTLIIAENENEEATPLATNVTSSSAHSVEIIKDAGWWPYLTLFFALLWLITALLAWRQRTSVTSAIDESRTTPPPCSRWQQLQHALEQQDGIAISHAVKIWMETLDLNQDERRQLEQALNQFNAQLYSANVQSSANLDELKQWISQIHQQQSKRQNQRNHPLAKL